MIKTLIRKQLLEIFQSYFINKKTGKARTRKGTVGFLILFVLLLICLGFAFFAMAMGMGPAIFESGMNWLYFVLMGLISMVLGVFGSVFNTYAGLYLPKDNEQLLALPIPVGKLLIARLSGVFITSLMYSALVWIPSIIAYWVMVPANALNVLFPTLLTFVIALFVSILSCILGWVVALVAAKTKGRSFTKVFLSLFVIVLYYVVYYKVLSSLEQISANLGKIGASVKAWLHYVYLLGCAAAGDVLPMLLVTGITAALAALCFFVLSKTFLKLATVKETGTRKARGGAKYMSKSRESALLRRELGHFTSVSTWMLNGGLGILMMPLGAVALVIKKDSIRLLLTMLPAQLPVLSSALPILLAVITCFIVSVNVILPVAVSMEGKTLWQLQSLPLDPWEVIRAKEKMGVVLNICPALIFTITAGIVFRLQWIDILFAACTVWLYVRMSSDFGLFLDLKMPNLNWTNVASLTKQSLPVVISLFGGWLFSAGIGVAAAFLITKVNKYLVFGGIIALFLILWAVFHGWLKKKGTAVFRRL